MQSSVRLVIRKSRRQLTNPTLTFSWDFRGLLLSDFGVILSFFRKYLFTFRCGFTRFHRFHEFSALNPGIVSFKVAWFSAKLALRPKARTISRIKTNQRYFTTPRSNAHIVKKSRSLWTQTNHNTRVDHVIGELLVLRLTIVLSTLQIFVFRVFGNL